MKRIQLLWLSTMLVPAIASAYSLLRVEDQGGRNSGSTMADNFYYHRRCTITANSIIDDRIADSNLTRRVTPITLNPDNNIAQLVGSVKEIPNLHLPPHGTPGVNYWLVPDDGSKGFIFRSVQRPAGKPETIVEDGSQAGHSLASYIDINCN